MADEQQLGGENDQRVINRDLTLHLRYLKRKYPGTILAFNNKTGLYRLKLMVDPVTEFFIEAFLYPVIMEARFMDFKETIRKLVKDAERELTEQMKEDGLKAANKIQIN